MSIPMKVSWARSSPEELRRHHAQDAAALAGSPPKDVVATALAAEGAFRGGLLFTPPDCIADAVFVYFHGGGFVAGSPETHRSLTAWLAKLSGMRVLSARYRLAPEHPFPAQREDAFAACRVIEDDARIFLAGDSAGACVALWGWQALDLRMRARVEGLVLLYGGYGLAEGDSIAHYGTPENGLDSAALSVMYGRLGEAVVWPREFAGEITAPAYVLAAELDAVRDDSDMLFRCLPAGAAHEFVLVRGQDHGFFKRTGQDPVAMRELDRAARWASARRKSRMEP
jgi:acetyl esterase